MAFSKRAINYVTCLWVLTRVTFKHYRTKVTETRKRNILELLVQNIMNTPCTKSGVSDISLTVSIWSALSSSFIPEMTLLAVSCLLRTCLTGSSSIEIRTSRIMSYYKKNTVSFVQIVAGVCLLHELKCLFLFSIHNFNATTMHIEKTFRHVED